MKIVKRSIGALALMVAALATGAVSSTAHADMKVCDNYHTDIWFAFTVDDASCSGNHFKQDSWWFIPQGQCVTIFTHTAANHTYWTYAEAADGSRTWPGSGTLTWNEIYSAGFGQDPNGTCFDNAQLRCTNSGVSCVVRPHAQNVIGNSTRFTITYANN